MPQACNVTVAAVSGALDSLLVDCHDWRFVSRPQPLTFVVGHCDKEYTVKLDRERHTCTCPIMRKSKTPCSHVLYVLTRLMGVSTRNPMLHLTCFSDHDLALFAVRRIVQERDPVASVARHADDEGALCAICLDPISVRPTVYCKYGCGASLHRDCFVELVKQQTHTRVVKVTCPCCRATWAPLRTRHRVTALEMLQYRELKPEDYELLLSLEANDVKQPTRANAADVEALETQTYHEDEPCCEGAMPEVRTCAICLDDLKEGQTCAKLRCGHYFHDSCVAEWMTKGRATCPLDETPIELLPRVENDPTPSPAHFVAPTPSSPRAVTTTLPAIAPSATATRAVAAPRLATAARAQRVRRVTAVPSFSPVYVLSDAPTTATHEIETSFPLASAHTAPHIRHLLHRSGRR